LANTWLFGTTAFIAVMSAVVSLALGFPIGNWLASLGRLKKIITSVLLVPFLLPAFLVGLAFRPLFGDLLDDSRVGIVAVIAAHALMNAGFIAVVTAASMIPREQAEAASLDGASRGTIVRRIQLPQQLPALSAAGLLVALYSATSFGLVITLGQGSVRTLETEIATAALQRLDLPQAALLALLQTALTLLFFVFSRRFGASPTALFGHTDTHVVASPLGRFLGMGLIGAIVWVLGGVFARAVSAGPGLVGNLVNLAGRGERDILNVTVVEAVGNSFRNMLVAVVLSLALAWWLSAKRVGLAVLIPVGISPVVIGLTALVLSGYLPTWAATSWLLLPIVQVIFLTPLAFQIISPARRSMSSELLEAAQLDGASPLQRFGLVELPTLVRPAVAATALVSLASFGEFGAARFLTYGSNETLPLVMFRLMSRPGGENLGMAMAAASVFIVLAVVVVWAVSFASDRGAVREGGGRGRG
jgi:thiamine transport system permease protein